MPIEVREAKESELDQIIELQNTENRGDYTEALRGYAEDPAIGIGAFTVAVDGGRVVSSMLLLPSDLRVSEVEVGASEVDYVATLPGYRGQGLIRRQFDLVHEWSVARGDHVQLIAGIAYYYRLFGYEYAIAMPTTRLVLPGFEPATGAGWQVRSAGAEDVDAILRLERDAERAADVVSSASAERWRKRVERPRLDPGNVDVVVACRDGRVEGVAAFGGGPPGVGDGVTMLSGLAVDSRSAALELVGAAQERGKPVAIERRPGTLGDAVTTRFCGEHPRAYAYYVRVADLRGLLDHLRPALDARLAASVFADVSTSVLISLYRSSVTLRLEKGRVAAVEETGPEQDPLGRGGAGVAPDLVATLVFGRYGASGLAARHDDVRLGAVVGLMDVLFPPLVADILVG